MGLREFLKRLIRSKEKEGVKEGADLREWEEEVRKLTNHPLSQVKVINTALLESLTGVLKNIDYKLNNLEKLDKIIEILEKKEIFEEKFEKINFGTKNLSDKDFMIFNIIKEKKAVTIGDLMNLAKISRSTASYRLNKLVYLGLVEKKMVGKRAVFVPHMEEDKSPK